MNLLFALTMYPPSTGGAQLNQHMLAQQLRDEHKIQVVTHWDRNRSDWLLGTTVRAPRHSRDYVIDGIEVHRLGLSPWEKLCLAPFVAAYYPCMDRAIPPIAHCVERHLWPYASSADLVHSVRIGREAMSFAALNVARRRDIPFVLTTVHHPRWHGWRYRAYNCLYTMADAVLALTNVEKDMLIEIGVRADRIFVTGAGPAPLAQPASDDFAARHGIDGPFVLFLGQHYQYKGYRQLLMAAPRVWQAIPEAHFVFIGPAVGRSDDAFARVPDRRIHRLGTVDLQTKTDALAACTLLCVPSMQESFGLVFTEAWTFGKPVIGGKIPAVAEVITDNVDGYLVDQDPDQIAERIIDLIQHPERAQALGRAGQRKAREQFAWQQVAERTLLAYQHVTGSHSDPSSVAPRRLEHINT